MKVLAKGNCDSARDGGEEADSKVVSRRTETSYKAEPWGELAQHSEAHRFRGMVNGAIVLRKSTILSGEICPTGRPVQAGSAGVGNSSCDWTEVSRSHSRSGSRPATGAIGNELWYSRRWSHPTEGRNLQGHATVLAAQAVMKPYGGAVL